MASSGPLTLKNLSGKYRPAKDSGDVTPVLALQGFGRMARFAMSRAPVYVAITQKSDDEVEIAQTTTASIPGVTERWNHDWEWREYDDSLFKRVKCRSRWVKAKDVAEAWLVEGLDPEEMVVEAENSPVDDAWLAHQVWRVEDGRFARRTITTKGAEKVQLTLTYEPQK